MKPVKVMFVTDSPVKDTGFGKLVRYIASGMFEHMIQPNGLPKYIPVCYGWYHHRSRFNLPYKIYHTAPSQEDKWGQLSLEHAIDVEHPQIVVTLADTWMVDHVAALRNRRNFSLVHYMPVDGEPVPEIMFHMNKAINYKQFVKQADHIVAYGKYGQAGINKMCGSDVCKVTIPFGVDTRIFHPAVSEEEKRAARREHYPAVPENAFLIGFFSRNQPRKGIDKLIHAVSLFQHGREKKDRPVYLYLHCALQDSAGWNIVELMNYFNIKKGTVIADETLRVGSGITDEQLRGRYIACDAMVLPTKGEGWGMTIQEAMACGLPVVTSNHSAHPEYCAPGSLFVKAASFEVEAVINTTRVILSTTDLVEQIGKLYNTKSLCEKLGRQGREAILSTDWSKIIPQWEAFLDSVDLSNLEPYYNNEAIQQLEEGIITL